MKLSENPLFRYQFITSSASQFRQNPVVIGAVMFAIAICYLFLLFVFSETNPGTAGTELVLFLTCLIAPLISHRLFSQEYERATWEFLAISPLSAREILQGKLGSALVRWTIIFLFGAVLIVVGSEAIPSPAFWRESTIPSCLMVWSWGVFLVSFSSWLSLRLRNTIAVVALVFTLQVVLLLMIPIVLGIALSLSWVPMDLAVNSVYEGLQTWLLALTTGNIFIWLNPFWAISEFSGVDGWNEATNQLRLLLWGWMQSAFYLAGAGMFAYFTYLRVCKEWRKR